MFVSFRYPWRRLINECVNLAGVIDYNKYGIVICVVFFDQLSCHMEKV